MTREIWLFLPVVVGIAVLTACTAVPTPTAHEPTRAADTEAISAVRLALATIPANVNCVRLTGQSGMRAVQIKASVTPGLNAPATFAGLRPGSWTLDLEAFAQVCSSVSDTTLPTWVSTTVTTTLAPGQNDLGFVLRPAADVKGSIDFINLTLTGPDGFGVILIGNAETHTFTVKNVGKAAAQITVTVTGGIGNQFTAAAPCPTLAANASCTGTVIFRPSFPGTTFAQLSVTGSPGGTVTAPLLGTGTLGPSP